MAKKQAGKPRLVTRRRSKGPLETVLPGMEKMRISDLDDALQAMASGRERIAELHKEDDGHVDAALDLLRVHKLQAYSFAGLRVARKPGTETLVVSRVNAAAKKGRAHGSEPAAT